MIKQNKEKNINIRVNEAEAQLFKEVADKNYESVAQMVRRLVRKEAKLLGGE